MSDMTLQEFAEITKRSKETLRRLARGNRLPGAYKIGGRWLINRDVYERLRNGDGGHLISHVGASHVEGEGAPR